MAHPFAVLDTNIIILLCTEQADESPEEKTTELQRAAVREWITELTPRARFALPTVVIAELYRPHGPEQFLEVLARAIGRFRVLPFTRSAGFVAARMAASTLASRPKGSERRAVKFDTLIAATAHTFGADYVLTNDERDYRTPLAAVGSRVTPLVATKGRPGSQVVIPITRGNRKT